MMQSANTHTGFKALVAANRKAGRLATPVERDENTRMLPTGMRLWPDELAQAKELADADERSTAWFCRRIYLRGLESYLAAQGHAPAAQ